MSTALVWFRNDLRLHDNPALYTACKNYEQVIFLYIEDTSLTYRRGTAQNWWLHHSLNALQQSLQREHAQLVLRRGPAKKVLSSLAKEHHVDTIFWNRCYEPEIIRRDIDLKTTLKTQGIIVHTFNASLLYEPWEIKNTAGSFFKVFTPYWKRCLATQKLRSILPKPRLNNFKKIASDKLEHWNLLPTWPHQFGEHWQPSEQGAHTKLTEFIDEKLAIYTERDKPGVMATSHLSPYLHFGEISPVQVWHTTQQAMAHNSSLLQCGSKFLTELGWREFSYHLLYHFPQLAHENFRTSFDNFPWQNTPSLLSAWQKGQTGYPIVDAGMRELWNTGYMHNRVRMIVASFLTKDCLVDWRQGAQWFLDTLLDADLASNSMNWQWVAGCGPDAAPYFRIFNPTLQSKKFDAEGIYIKRWLPELKNLPLQFIHQPWQAPTDVLAKAHIQLGENYPFPILDHSMAHHRALTAYNQIKKS